MLMSLIHKIFGKSKKLSTGEEGERRAEKFLKKKGFRILQKNYLCKTGELDIVAKEGETLVFVEVKTRKKHGKELPEAAMTAKKKHRVSYRLTNKLFRFDVIGLEFDDENNWEIFHWQNAINYKQALARKY